MSDQRPGRTPSRESAQARRERLAAELRANLHKRKAQARARAAAEKPDDTAGSGRGSEGNSEA